MLDFDGTVTQKDIGDEICDRFAPPAWRDIDAAWVRNEISLPDAQRQMWALARAERPEALAYAREIGHLRPGLDALLAAARRCGRVGVAGLGRLRLLHRGAARRAARACSSGATSTPRASSTGRIEVDFPHAELACGRCAVCKGKVCDAARAARAADACSSATAPSDRCAIGRADRIFAVRGSLLERACAERGVACVPFDDFAEVAASLPTPART